MSTMDTTRSDKSIIDKGKVEIKTSIDPLDQMQFPWCCVCWIKSGQTDSAGGPFRASPPPETAIRFIGFNLAKPRRKARPKKCAHFPAPAGRIRIDVRLTCLQSTHLIDRFGAAEHPQSGGNYYYMFFIILSIRSNKTLGTAILKESSLRALI